MALKLMGKKKGMTLLFDDNGRAVPVTIIECEPNVVTQIKTVDTDGYNALQLGFEKIHTKDPRTKERRVGKPRMGHFKKASVEPCRHLHEARLDDVSEYTVGQEITLEAFNEITYLDVSSLSKGKGFQGVIKVHNFCGGPASHGSGFHRSGGSTGMRSTPGIVLSGQKKPKRLGGKMVTIQNSKVFRIDMEKSLLMVVGPIPGATGSVVYLQAAVKKIKS